MRSTLAKEGIEETAVNYVDDIAIATKTKESHGKALFILLSVLEKHGWTVKETKIEWMKEKIEFLGHSVSQNGINASETFEDRFRACHHRET